MRRILDGVDLGLDEEQNEAEQEHEPDGQDLDENAYDAQQSMQFNTESETRIACEWENFARYMCEQYGEERFTDGYQRVKEHHE